MAQRVGQSRAESRGFVLDNQDSGFGIGLLTRPSAFLAGSGKGEL